MYGLYSLMLALGAVATGPYWILQGLRGKKYFRSLLSRLGWKMPEWRDARRPVWIHAVSVGEVLAAKVLFAELLQAQPSLPVIVSTVTAAGQALAQKELGKAAAHLYFPFDWQFAVTRFLERFQPRAVVLMETELWPNFVRACSIGGIPVFLANGRISDRSCRRYALVRPLIADVLGRLEMLGVQTDEDARRFAALGAAKSRIRVTGNLKFDYAPAREPGACELLERIGACLGLSQETLPVVVGSSMKGEEGLFLRAFRALQARLPQTRLILAPRHPERFEEVAGLIAATGLPWERRSRLGDAAGGQARIVLLDSIGELRSVYALAEAAVIGGSFLPFGGHNLLEPAALGKAVIFGPHMNNFREAARMFLDAGAARQCGPEDLAGVLAELMENPELRRQMGRQAERILQCNRGAAAATARFLLPYIGG